MGGGGGWGAVGGVKHPFGLKGQCCAFSKCHELIQSTREAQTAVRSSLVPHAVLLTHPRTMKCTLVVSQHRQKAVCKSRPGNLLSSAWCFWIVHECAYHVQAKDGFQLLCLNGRFSKIRSQIKWIVGFTRALLLQMINVPSREKLQTKATASRATHPFVLVPNSFLQTSEYSMYECTP